MQLLSKPSLVPGVLRPGGKRKGKEPEPELPPDVRAAIAAVDAAVRKLPEEGDVKFTVMEAQEGGGWNQGHGGDPQPLNAGSKVRLVSCFRRLSSYSPARLEWHAFECMGFAWLC